jgi:hypothetical protein
LIIIKIISGHIAGNLELDRLRDRRVEEIAA